MATFAPPTPSALPDPSTPAAPRPLAWAHTARFLTTAAQLNQLPETGLPELAFVGRSNAGKSTAINTLAQQRRLAFASKTPGRTQHINLFALGPRDAPNALLADLPGYGYAAVERQAKLRWQRVMADYLATRPRLAGVVLLVDPRLGLTELDQRLLSFVQERVDAGTVKLLVVLTKADKLNRVEAREAMHKAQAVLAEQVGEAADVGLLLFSALKRSGVEDLAQCLHDWVASWQPPAEDLAPESSAAPEGAASGEPSGPAHPA